MKKINSIAVLLAVLTLMAAVDASAQSGREFRRSAVMRGNLVKTVFGNWGVIGQPSERGTRGAWIYDNNGYIGDVSPLVGAEVTVNGQTFHSVVVSPASRPTLQVEQSPAGIPWGFEPMAGYLNENQQSVALFSDPNSWPPYWPDKLDDPEDPGWRGSWNGFFGKSTTAAEEAFFVMDDNADEEFNYAENNRWGVEFKPDAFDAARNGLGLQVRVRAMQWSDFLAQDCIFWLYEITNTGTYNYSKVAFGMLVGTYIGVTSTEDFHEYDDDYSFFDVEKDLTYTADFDDNAKRNPLWTGDVGVVGYAFLESPGNPYDGIDNDGDADAGMLGPGTGPYFTPEDFERRTINTGDRVVLIDDQYERTVVIVGGEKQKYATFGDSIEVDPGVTQLAEGNVILVDGQEEVNPNAYDGIDNDLDGVIDENYYLHYRQLRRDTNGNVLIDRLNPVRFINYITGQGVGDYLIDEKRTDGIDNDGDWNPDFDDVGADGLLGTADRGEGDGLPTPGEPNFDQTDVDESDQIGLTSFEYFTPAREFSMADDEDLWRRLQPGHFEVPASIVNNKPQRGEDGDFIYGSGFFPLRAGETQYFSLALVYGEGGGPQVDIADLLNNRETVQKIYDSDYRFPPAPDKPTLVAVPGDGKVTLYWDRKSEKSFDPVLKEYDFEGYKIYRATDHNFNEVFSITDGTGTAIAYEPIAQFDKDNNITGYFRASAELYQQGKGATFFLGDDSGLQHTFVDTDVENGRRYFYAVVAYDKGDETADIFPKENDKRIDLLPSGEVRTFQNTAVVMPNAQVAGYTPPSGSKQVPAVDAVGTGQIFAKVVDEEVLTGHNYRIHFIDSSNDGIDNDEDWNAATDDVGSDGIAGTQDADGTEGNNLPDAGEPNIDGRDPDEYFVPITTYYTVEDLNEITETVSANDTFIVALGHENIIPATFSLTDAAGNALSADKYELDSERGRMRGVAHGDLSYGTDYTATYRYYPIFESPYIESNPNETETLDTDIFDGVWLSFNNYWKVTLDTARSYWSNPNKGYDYNFNIIDTYIGSDRLLGLRHPADYRIIFSDDVVDTSLADPTLFVKAIPTNFTILDVTKNRKVDFIYSDLDRNKKLTPFDEIILVEDGNNGDRIFTWDLFFTSLSDTTFEYTTGDTLVLNLKKPFQSGDIFELITTPPEVDEAAAEDMMKNIKVVPNPYVVATSHELPLPPAVTSGRGVRKVDFIHMPMSAKVHIFTSRGEHVITLEHEGNMHDGTVPWNLKTKENLDVAAGIYFYVIESDYGTKRGKIGIIK